MADYIPRPDNDFLAWERNFITYALGNLVALGLVAGDLTPISAAQGTFEDALAANDAAQAAAQAARQLKVDQRAAFETLLRALVKRLQASSAVDDSERQALGITVRDAEPTPIAAPTTRPVLTLGLSQLYQITVGFADEGTPTKKAKPAGVQGILLQSATGATPPASDAAWTFLALDTATPYLMAFDSAQAGTTVWFRGCWINSKSEQGPWSMAVSAKVPG